MPTLLEPGRRRPRQPFLTKNGHSHRLEGSCGSAGASKFLVAWPAWARRLVAACRSSIAGFPFRRSSRSSLHDTQTPPRHSTGIFGYAACPNTWVPAKGRHGLGGEGTRSARVHGIASARLSGTCLHAIERHTVVVLAGCEWFQSTISVDRDSCKA
jgi:hypothetical protein